MNLRELAKNKTCMARLPHVCNFDKETTVLAHLRLPGDGIGIKPDDFARGAWCCSDCHDALDRRQTTGMTADVRHCHHMMAVLNTQTVIIRDHPEELIEHIRRTHE